VLFEQRFAARRLLAIDGAEDFLRPARRPQQLQRVFDAPSCTLLEVGDEGHLVPLISDAVKQVDLERKIIEVDRDFLGY
jgi:hypothetical protein